MNVPPVQLRRTPALAVALAMVWALLPAGIASAQDPASPIIEAEGCRASTLEANDDDSTDLVNVGFDIDLAGTVSDVLYVNNNGNVTFDEDLSQYTPEALDENGYPILAPFFADVDTRGDAGEDGNLVTYGQIEHEGRDAFCVNWTDVGYFSSNVDKLNTFQLVIVDRSDVRSGAVDVIYNYETIQWETGDASDGEDGFGGESAAAGYSAGTGELGTFLELECSRVNGACLDDGDHPLARTSTNSDVLGRHVFALRFETEQGPTGTLEGTVTDQDGSDIDLARVEACRTDEVDTCRLTVSQNGDFGFARIPLGTYRVRAFPPSGSDATIDSAEATVAEGETGSVELVLRSPQPPPEGITVGTGTAGNGIPTLVIGRPTPITVDDVDGCETPPVFRVLSDGDVVPIIVDGEEVLEATMVHDGEGWAAEFTVNITGPIEIEVDRDEACGGPVSFSAYIDPSGIVVDRAGEPLPDATVTLSRSTSPEGPFADVPDGSSVMSPSNRTNPDVTDEDGRFAWDVIAGYYVVTATLEGCGTAATEVLPVPPPQLDLVIELPCGEAPEPEPEPEGPNPPTCAGVEPTAFRDVPGGYEHAGPIGCAAGLDLVLGWPNGEFRPTESLTRGQLASVLLRALTASDVTLDAEADGFGDIAGSPHAEAIRRLAAADIVRGTSATTFDPNGPVTRGQVASMLDRASAQLLVAYPATAGPRFYDIAGSPHAGAIDRLNAAGIARGYNAEFFGPLDPIQRGQAASLVVRWLEDQAGRLA